MAVYKVPQDIEVADKILGPLSLKQLIFALLFFGSCYINYLFFKTFPLLIIAGLPFTFVFGVLAFYQRPDQPVEVYLMSAFRFYTMQRKRVWDQSGYEHRVEITAPKVVEVQRTKDLTETEIHSSLDALSAMMDTHGWASKNVGVLGAMGVSNSDRIMDIANIQSNVVDSNDELYEVNQQSDILDANTTSLARKFNTMVEQRAIQIRQQALAQVQNAQNPPAEQYTQAIATQQPVTYTTQAQPAPQAVAPIVSPQISQELSQLSTNDTATVASIAKKADELVEGGEIELH